MKVARKSGSHAAAFGACLAMALLCMPVSAARAGLAPDSAEPGIDGAAMKVKPAKPPLEEIIVRGRRDEEAAKRAYHEEVFRKLDLIYGTKTERAAPRAAGFSPDAGGMGAAGASPIHERSSSTVAAIRNAPRSQASKAIRGE